MFRLFYIKKQDKKGLVEETRPLCAVRRPVRYRCRWCRPADCGPVRRLSAVVIGGRLDREIEGHGSAVAEPGTRKFVRGRPVQCSGAVVRGLELVGAVALHGTAIPSASSDSRTVVEE